jgi:cadmium resistance protein CadD (predicted permease)
MLSSLALLGLAVALFVSTNIDDVFVLVGFFSDPKLRVHDIVIGQYIGLAGLFGVSVAASMLSGLGN